MVTETINKDQKVLNEIDMKGGRLCLSKMSNWINFQSELAGAAQSEARANTFDV